jgi:hypothetical protein
MSDMNVDNFVEGIWISLERFMSTQPYGIPVVLTANEHIQGWANFDQRDRLLVIINLNGKLKKLGYKMVVDYNAGFMSAENCAEVEKGINGAMVLWKRWVSELLSTL